VVNLISGKHNYNRSLRQQHLKGDEHLNLTLTQFWTDQDQRNETNNRLHRTRVVIKITAKTRPSHDHPQGFSE